MARKKIPLDEKCCPGCGVLNPKVASYCNSCQSASQSMKKGGWAHYFKIENSERKEILKFVDELIRKRGYLESVDIYRLLHYYQITHVMNLRYENYSPLTQVFHIFTDMLIWANKQRGLRTTFNNMTRPEVYKILMTKNATGKENGRHYIDGVNDRNKKKISVKVSDKVYEFDSYKSCAAFFNIDSSYISALARGLKTSKKIEIIKNANK